MTVVGGVRQLRLLGKAQLEVDGVVALEGGKALALLALLAGTPERRRSRAALLDLLWGDAEAAAARGALRSTIHWLRRRLGSDIVSAEGNALLLDPAVRCDRGAFIEAVAADRLESALDLYVGDFFPDFAAPGARGFEEWAAGERLRLRRMFVEAALAHGSALCDSGRFREAAAVARRARDADPDIEASWRLLLRAQHSAGDVVDARVEADALERQLGEEGIAPEPATAALVQAIRGSPSTAAALEQRATSLRADLVGRERAFSQLVGAWERARRGEASHLHLVAAAGHGKTRLIADFAERLRQDRRRTVLVRAQPGERGVPFALLAGVARAASGLPGAAGISSGAASSLVALEPALSASYSAASDTATGSDALRHRTSAVQELLDAIADEQPLAVLVDDLHWGDQESASALDAIAARLAGQRLLLVTASRPDLAIAPHDRLTTIGLEALDADQAVQLVASVAALPDAEWAEVLPRHLHEATRGSPLLLLESLQSLVDRGGLRIVDGTFECDDPAALMASFSLDTVAADRWNVLERAERWLVLLLSVAGAPVSLSELSAMTGQPDDRTRAALLGLEARGYVALVRNAEDPSWLLAHDTIAERSTALAESDSVRAAHAQLGRLLAARAERDRTRLARAVRHLVQADEADEARAVFARLWTIRDRSVGNSPGLLAREVLADHHSASRATMLVSGLPWWLRLRRGAIAAAAVSLVTLVAFSGALWARGRTETGTPVVELYLVPDDSATAGVLRARLPAASLGHEPFVVTSVPRPLPDMPLGRPIERPRFGGWAVVRNRPDSTTGEVFLRHPDGREVPLVTGPSEDYGGYWSPDGTKALAFTSRWDRENDTGAPVIVDVATGRTTRLHASTANAVSGFWSPDGSRVAWLELPLELAPPRICWSGTDGDDITCRTIPELDVPVFIGWGSPTSLLFVDDRRPTLQRLSLVDGPFSEIDARLGARSASPDGRWIVCHCRASDAESPVWIVYPTGRPDESSRLVRGGLAGLPLFRPSRDLRYVDTLRIVGVPEHVSSDGLLRARVRVADPSGRETVVGLLRWRTRDSLVATVSEDGIVKPARVGETWLVADAGGWRADSVRLRVGPPDTRVVFDERWGTGWTDRVIRFGRPLPTVVQGPDAVPAMWNNGDGSFASGVVGLDAWDARGGLGFEALLHTPITRSQQQFVTLTLAAVNLPLPPEWRDVGDARIIGTSEHCAIGRPGGEGYAFVDRVAVGTRNEHVFAEVDSSLRGDRWYRLRLQIFPDGRCGVAIGGVPLAITRTGIRLDRGMRFAIAGSSKGTRILVGPTTVWQGVRNDVPWRTLDQPAGEGHSR